MALEKMTENVEIVQTLSTYPNQEDGLSAEELKAKFDAGAKALKEYLNGQVVPAVQELERVVDPGMAYGLDTTLTVAGRAADAGAVGTALASKAPAGLVTKTIKVADEEALNNALSEEFATMAEGSARFIAVSPTSGALFGGVGMLCELYKRSSSGYGTAKFTGYGVNSPDILYKTLWAGTWQPLEWVNPPMHIGVEYRTTERWNGKPVYTICGDMGTLQSKSFKTFSPKRADGSGVSATQIVGYGGITGTGYAFPMRGSDISADYFANVEMYVNTDITAWVYCNLDWSTTTATLWFKYTKD